MSDPVFINKDAEFLWGLGATFLADEDFDTGMRLQSAARNLENLDERLRNLATTDDYTRGRESVFRELYERSNLPPEDRTMPRGAAQFKLGPDIEVKKIPKGKTAAQVKAAEELKAKAATGRASQLKSLGLKLNFSALSIKVPKE